MSSFSAQSTSEEVCQVLADHIKGSKVLITGVTLGSVGGEAALQLSRHQPALLVLAGRNLQTLQATENAIKAETPDANTRLLILDLSSQESVRKAAAEVKLSGAHRSSHQQRRHHGGTVHDYSRGSGTAKIISGGSKVRVVNVSSAGHKRGPVRFDDVNFENGKCYDKWQAYGQSKTANMLFTVSLAEKAGEKGVESFSLYPGRRETGIGRHLKPEEWVMAGWKHEDGSINDDPKLNWRTASQGAATLIVAAYDPSISDKNGSYMVNNKVNNGEAVDYALDPKYAEKLWKLSEEIVGQKFGY
ncbi:short-chain dehydrogenase [Aspergillus vadensis CBS 113365]|uniref:Short-chain dehydrogenase n=1 Tax=Aspergillus vadensis (strain CBS 113365 / IMI 142717 / IBT 24658) TaxID=1448311 RepID=A0A319BKB2_ASPVC|nr:short-chain dehydrogenase [Aspergillus vadensis CBS 113365]PYH73147.1 short-chain dehydrogenase [Aspergillus vadensis CBS 113365]